MLKGPLLLGRPLHAFSFFLLLPRFHNLLYVLSNCRHRCHFGICYLGAMARLKIPKVGCDLQHYNGTDPELRDTEDLPALVSLHVTQPASPGRKSATFPGYFGSRCAFVACIYWTQCVNLPIETIRLSSNIYAAVGQRFGNYD
ncbi:hypothetical protein F4806DRAFT_157960 [Annulohypoxylon nitens]|nr:hypothetical protein F4806DRAFT_157960 [Annulohypoxylon nitens]